MFNNVVTYAALFVGRPKPATYLVAGRNRLGQDFLFQTDVRISRHIVEFAQFVYNTDTHTVLKNRYPDTEEGHNTVIGKIRQLMDAPRVDLEWLEAQRMMGQALTPDYPYERKLICLEDADRVISAVRAASPSATFQMTSSRYVDFDVPPNLTGKPRLLTKADLISKNLKDVKEHL